MDRSIPKDKQDSIFPPTRRAHQEARGRARSRSRSRSQYRHDRGRRTRSHSRSPPPRVYPNTHHQPSPSPYREIPLPLRRREGSVDTTLPKYSATPLTCFFWHYNGRCNKRDEDCVYAHWETGFLAGAPVKFGGATGHDSVAGLRARKYTPSITTTPHKELEEKVEALELREQDLKTRLDAVTRREKDLEKLVRLREKEFKLREKKITRKEEALSRAGSTAWTCTKCEGRQEYQGSP